MQDLIINEETIKKRRFIIRGMQVMLDSDLAGLYDVSTKHINRAVKRNIERFPEDFMFQLTSEELEILRCQNGTSLNRALKPQNSESKENSLRSQIVTLEKGGRNGSHSQSLTKKL